MENTNRPGLPSSKPWTVAPHEQTQAQSSGQIPTLTWDAINKRVFNIEAHLRMVSPAWTE